MSASQKGAGFPGSLRNLTEIPERRGGAAPDRWSSQTTPSLPAKLRSSGWRGLQSRPAARVLCPAPARPANSDGISLVFAEFPSIPRKTHEAGAHAAGTELGGVRMLWEWCRARRGRGGPGARGSWAPGEENLAHPRPLRTPPGKVSVPTAVSRRTRRKAPLPASPAAAWLRVSAARVRRGPLGKTRVPRAALHRGGGGPARGQDRGESSASPGPEVWGQASSPQASGHPVQSVASTPPCDPGGEPDTPPGSCRAPSQAVRLRFASEPGRWHPAPTQVNKPRAASPPTWKSSPPLSSPGNSQSFSLRLPGVLAPPLASSRCQTSPARAGVCDSPLVSTMETVAMNKWRGGVPPTLHPASSVRRNQ